MVQHRSKLLAEQDNQVRNDLDLLDQRHTYQLPHLCYINVHVYCPITCTCMCSSTNTKKVDNLVFIFSFHPVAIFWFQIMVISMCFNPCFTGHFPTYLFVSVFGKNHPNSWFVSCNNFSDYYSARITAWPQRYGTKLIGCTAHMEATYWEGS